MDDIYIKKLNREQAFQFNKKTAEVFDDMLYRSIPFYDEIQNMIEQLVNYHIRPKCNVYDLGCSTGTTLVKLAGSCRKKDVKFIGIENSTAMLKNAQDKLKKRGLLERCVLLNKDLNKNITIKNACAVILNLTLHFIRPINRDFLISQIYSGLMEKGILILVEKILSDDPELDRAFIDFYYKFKKKNRYSKIEIQQKRVSLENVLVPYSYDENCKLLRKNGFKKIEEFFRWYGWCGIIAIK